MRRGSRQLVLVWRLREQRSLQQPREPAALQRRRCCEGPRERGSAARGRHCGRGAGCQSLARSARGGGCEGSEGRCACPRMGAGLRWRRRLCCLLPLVLHLVLTYGPVGAASRRCDTIYKGFAECLISLGDSIAANVQTLRDAEEKTMKEEAQELDTICKSWDDFHNCATAVLANCPEEAANIWESLRQESRKIQYQGNLHDLCSARTRPSNSMREADSPETNKETLRGSASFPHHQGLLAMLFLAVFLVAII
ncbi:neuritin-like protein [Ambystoma mexicanum]|uniref:neuritin-like protein n=1 Tax=Ambystoma mexicanum TaxID=8296 RepID=UPI0037E986C1